MDARLYQLVAISWFVAAAVCVDVLVRYGWLLKRSRLRLKIDASNHLPLLLGFMLSLCPLLFSKPVFGVLCVSAFWVLYLSVGHVAEVACRRMGMGRHSINDRSWSPRSGLVFAFSRFTLIVAVAVGALVAVSPTWTQSSWTLLAPAGWLARNLWGIDPSDQQLLRAGLLAGIAVALAVVNVVLASGVLELLLGGHTSKPKSLLTHTWIEPPKRESLEVSPFIGMLERSVITLLAITGDFTAAGFVAAIKAFGSSRMENGSVSPAAAVVGTLVSVLIAFATALPARWLLSMGGVI
jgi:hypothetical protein